MATLTWSHAAEVDAGPDAVFAWMSDFRPDDHATEAFLRGAGEVPKKPAARKVVRRQGQEVVLEDTWQGRRFRLTARLDPKAREVRLQGEMGYVAVWRALPQGRGTRLEVAGTLEARGVFGLLLPLFAKRFQAETARDFRGHVEDLRTSLRAAP